MRLVADIGGTNARVALSHGGLILAETVHHYANDEWDSLYAVLKDFLKTSEVQPDEMVIAVAGPVSSGRARLTNRDWDRNLKAEIAVWLSKGQTTERSDGVGPCSANIDCGPIASGKCWYSETGRFFAISDRRYRYWVQRQPSIGKVRQCLLSCR